MVAFDATEAGTSAAVWDADPRTGNRPALDIRTATELLVVAAHPDDETLGAGGLIAHAAGLGVPVRVVCVTDGSASHPDDPGIAVRRAEELEAAVRVLAPDAAVELLDFPDGQVREHRAAILAALDTRVSALLPGAIIAAPWRGDGHRDHRIVGEIVTEVAGDRRVLEYPVWLWHWGSPDHPDVPWARFASLRVDGDLKARALRKFTSQIDGDAPILRPDFLAHFLTERELLIVGDAPLGGDYFDDIYARSTDPWRFRTRWYEERKRALTVASLPHRRYRNALEVGGSIGILTGLLAERCDDLLSVDISREAVELARTHVGDRARVEHRDILSDFPPGQFDLIVLSEVGYYWGAAGLATTLGRVRAALSPGAVVVACHWRHAVPDYPMSGDEVHAAIAAMGWHRIVAHTETDFLLEVFAEDARSVAQREGLA